ncbi:hypothetical protein CBOM_04861 [Ceraceosorus bombacis]|uniref:Uncharacterized protein n=1 Tax=Ceraceosorus bombacis TaxID=401625 RepID=A0A0P1BNH7_9BASI|nr:hypothetical protein CBOM_04861 [Ceraceosorus bombacis]
MPSNRDSGNYDMIDLDLYLTSIPTPPARPPVGYTYPPGWLDDVKLFKGLDRSGVKAQIEKLRKIYSDQLNSVAGVDLKKAMSNFSDATGMVFPPNDLQHQDERRPQMDWDESTFGALAAGVCALNESVKTAIQAFGLEGKQVKSIDYSDSQKNIGGVYGTRIELYKQDMSGQYFAPRPGFAIRRNSLQNEADFSTVTRYIAATNDEPDGDASYPVLAHRMGVALRKDAQGKESVQPALLKKAANYMYGLTLHELGHFSQYCNAPVWDLEVKKAKHQSRFYNELTKLALARGQAEPSYWCRGKTQTISKHLYDVGCQISEEAVAATNWHDQVGLEAPFKKLSQWFPKGASVRNAVGNTIFDKYDFDEHVEGAALKEYRVELENAKISATEEEKYVQKLINLVNIAKEWVELRISYEYQLSKQACNLVNLVKVLDAAHRGDTTIQPPRGLDVVVEFTWYLRQFYDTAQKKTIAAIGEELKKPLSRAAGKEEVERRQLMNAIWQDVYPDLFKINQLKTSQTDPDELQRLEARRYERVFAFGASQKFFNRFAMEFHAELTKVSKGAPEEFLLNPVRDQRQVGAASLDKDLDWRLPRDKESRGKCPTEKQLGILFEYSISDRHLYDGDKPAVFPADPYEAFIARPIWAPKPKVP